MNYVRKNLLKPNGKIIPELITSSAQLVQTNYDFFGFKFPMVQHEWDWCKNKVKDLSGVKQYHEADFSGFIEEKVNKEIVFRIEKSGIINGIRLLSTIYPIKGREDLAIGATISVCPPTIIPCEEKKVSKGNKVKVELSYSMGRGYDSVKIDII
jgi:predicted RNA methylase